jgi:hypothetical protein
MPRSRPQCLQGDIHIGHIGVRSTKHWQHMYHRGANPHRTSGQLPRELVVCETVMCRHTCIVQSPDELIDLHMKHNRVLLYFHHNEVRLSQYGCTA